MSATLLLQFDGWCLIRLPTDPDPHDETRGISGYTFAFAGEPDLDRIVHLQPPTDIPLRSYSPEVGVFVRNAMKQDAAGSTPIPILEGAKVSLLDNPELQNRNWTLTLPGYEPIVPFHLQIAGDNMVLQKTAPLVPADPDMPLWQVPQAQIVAHGARGMEYEPETIGHAIGIWNSMQIVQERCTNLQKDLAELKQHNGDPIAITALEGRISELQFAIANPTDRRVLARYFVERFGFQMMGDSTVTGETAGLQGTLAAATPWFINFWMGAWDPDLLCCFMQGSLAIPYAE